MKWHILKHFLNDILSCIDLVNKMKNVSKNRTINANGIKHYKNYYLYFKFIPTFYHK